MSPQAANTVLVQVFCPDRTGLVAALAGRLFDLGADLGDTTFAVLGGGAEFSSVCTLPHEVGVQDVADSLRALPELADAEIEVTPFTLSPVHGPGGRVTHRIVIGGGDRPGLVARLAEVFGQYRANIVRLDAQRIPDAGGGRYMVRFAVSLPPESAAPCLATVANTAGEMGLSCHWENA